MTSSPRYRTMSPAGTPVVDPPRASTGTVQLSPLNHNDPRDVPASRHAYTTSHPSDIYHASLHDPRVSRAPGVDVQTASTNYRTPDHTVTKPRTEYTVPRQRSSTTSAADGRPLPLRLTVSPNGPSRHSPVISSAHARSSSPWSADHERYLVPASPSHGHSGRRVYNYGYASDAGRPVRPRADRGEYHASTGRRRHHPAASRKPRDIDDYDAYSYTNPREQFEKDSVDHMGRRRGVYRERPLSLTGAEDYYPAWAPKKESRTSGPPPSQRGFDKIDRVEDGRARRSIVGGGESTGAGRSAWGQRDPLSLHDPFSLPPDWDDAYRSSPYRDEHYDDSHRHHSRRQQYPEDDSHRRSKRHEHTSSLPGPTGAEPGVLGLGSASLAAGYNDSSYNVSSMGDWADYSGHGHGTRRPRSRLRKPTRRRAGTDTDGHAPGVGDIHKYSRDPYGYHVSNTKDQSPSYMTADDLRRGENSHSRSHVDDRYSRKDTSSRQTSGGSSQDERRRSSESPASSKDAGTQQTQQLKSILKQPKEKFPEEPNPVREGVAPLKDAHKKGIPPGARWTKVDRRLVNPEALKACNERFEERSDYVIVLRVLSKEEIQTYALLTQEIRGKLPCIMPLKSPVVIENGD